MTVLRSREIPPTPKTTQTPHKTTPKPSKPPKPIEPSTPSQMPSSAAPRRSLRIAVRRREGDSDEPSASAPESSEAHRRVRRRTSVNGDCDGSEDRNVDSEVSEPPADKGKGTLESCRNSSDEEGVNVDGNGKENGGGINKLTREEKGKEKLVEEDEEIDYIGGAYDRDRSRLEELKKRDRERAQRFAQDIPEYIQEAAVVSDSEDSDKDEDIDDEEVRPIGYRYGCHARPNGVVHGREDGPVAEDWPGPFSTALGIIRDREKAQAPRESESGVSAAADLDWTPKFCQPLQRPKPVPSLFDLSLKVLIDNAESLVSLKNVPEVFTDRIFRMLCNSRRITTHFLKLLARASPTEIVLADCSWMAEEEFVEAFQSFDSSVLTVIKLDQCGRSLPDHVILATLGRSPNCLPVLTTVSLSGACRLSETGLRALARSAPALTSLNISQSSLIDHTSIDVLAKHFASTLKELYLQDCQELDAICMLPALKKFEKLEILSVSGIKAVCHKFIKGFVKARGSNIKELILAGCVKLSDKSLKVVAENCPGLRAIDLSNCKLTDSSLGYLANGCKSIQRLVLSCNSFSDSSVAAFLVTSGEHLNELSLNKVRKVGSQTALSIAKRATKLQRLDLSWCRNLTDNALGHIVDNCPSLRLLKIFGCTQVTLFFVNGHANVDLKIIGLEMSPLLEHL